MKRFAFLALLSLAGCADEPQRGTYEGAGPTIVSLNPCTDAILGEIAAPGQLLAVSHYSHDAAATSMPLSEALSYRATGGSVEELLALDPDVVVAGGFLDPATRRALDALGIRVETFGPPTGVAESIAQVDRLGALAGRPMEAEALATRISDAWEHAGFEGQPVTIVLLQQGGIVPGPESLIARLMERSGFSLHSAARRLGQGGYLSLEEMLADPPGLVLAAGGDRMLTHPVLARARVEHFDPALLYCGGPSIIAALERLAQLRNANRRLAARE